MPLKQYFNKPLAVSVALATVATATLAQSASAATFNFSFSNVSGGTNGTVQGTIELPDGDGIDLAATSVVVTSAPAALGYTLPFNVLANFPFVSQNSFTVNGGAITGSNFVAQSVPPGDFGSIFAVVTNTASLLNFSGQQQGSTTDGVFDSGSTTLTFSSGSTAAVPEPATVLGLLSVAGVGLLSKRQKQ